jgi:hypothetical protein
MSALLHVFYQPGELFSSLPDRRRAWIIPLVVNCILAMAIWAVEVHYMGFITIVRQQLAAIHMRPENMAIALERANTPARLYGSYIQTAFAVTLGALLISGVLKALSLMTGRSPRFGAMLSMVALAQFPYFLVVLLMTTLILTVAPDPGSLSVRNLIATNPAAYMDKETMSPGLYSLLESVDLLSFAEIFLLSYGFGKLTRAGFFAGLAAVLGMWIVYVSCKMALSLLF